MFAVFALYLVLFSGFVYDIVYAPAGIGNENGRPVAFYRFNLGKQYIVEGIASALMLFLGGVGFIGVTTFGPPIKNSVVKKKHWKPEWRHYFYLAMNAGLVIVAYNMLLLFTRLKLPNYLQLAKR